jgi:hypothetical protein
MTLPHATPSRSFQHRSSGNQERFFAADTATIGFSCKVIKR